MTKSFKTINKNRQQQTTSANRKISQFQAKASAAKGHVAGINSSAQNVQQMDDKNINAQNANNQKTLNNKQNNINQNSMQTAAANLQNIANQPSKPQSAQEQKNNVEVVTNPIQQNNSVDPTNSQEIKKTIIKK
jgi:hypothetical protein